LRVHVESSPLIADNKEIGRQGKKYKEKIEEHWPLISVPVSEIKAVTKQGTKNWKPLNDGEMLGLTFFGAGSFLLLAGVISEGESKENGIEGGIFAMGIGLGLMAIFERTTYYLDNSLNTGTKDKIWKIK